MKPKRMPTVNAPLMTAVPPNQRTRQLPTALKMPTAGQNADMMRPASTFASMFEMLARSNSRRVAVSLEKDWISRMPLTLSSILAETLAMVLRVLL